MDEAEWLASSDIPRLMITGRRKGLSARKQRLLACAFLRRFWDRLSAEGRELVDLAEAFAEGERSEQELMQACRARGLKICQGLDRLQAHLLVSGTQAYVKDETVIMAARYAARYPKHHFLDGPTPAHQAALAAERSDQRALVHCIVGNPFRRFVCDPSWRTLTVLGLAQACHGERAFDRLPILADALEDAGCSDPTILDHCRGPGPHARGCWVVDQLLGRSETPSIEPTAISQSIGN